MENEEINRKLDLIIEQIEEDQWPSEWVTGGICLTILLIIGFLF
jgi:hypothetical protein